MTGRPKSPLRNIIEIMPAAIGDAIRDQVLPPGIADQAHLRWCWCQVGQCGACEHGDHRKCFSGQPGCERWVGGGGAGFFTTVKGFGRPGYPQIHHADRHCFWTCPCPCETRPAGPELL
jgi:hypothetical protein